MIQIPQDFREFLRLLNYHNVEYLLIGGYAVGYYGFVRATGDMDIWMGVPPLRLEILTTISGVDFAKCFQNRLTDQIDGIDVNLINLEDLKINKKASGRLKDLLDLENLP